MREEEEEDRERAGEGVFFIVRAWEAAKARVMGRCLVGVLFSAALMSDRGVGVGGGEGRYLMGVKGGLSPW